MCTEQNIPHIDHINSIQPENHLNESNINFNKYGTIDLQIIYPSVSLNIIDGMMIVAILITCFKKTLTKRRKVVHNFQTKKTMREYVALLRPLLSTTLIFKVMNHFN